MTLTLTISQEMFSLIMGMLSMALGFSIILLITFLTKRTDNGDPKCNKSAGDKESVSTIAPQTEGRNA